MGLGEPLGLPAQKFACLNRINSCRLHFLT